MAEVRFDTDISMGGNGRITGLPAPVAADEAATKGYADGLSAGAGFPLGFYGDGSDGDVTISSGTTTLTRDMCYDNLTITAPGILNTAGFRVFVRDTLNISAAGAGALQCNGANGNNGATAGTGGAAAAGAGGNILHITTRNPGGAGGTAAGTVGASGGSIIGLVSGGMGGGGSGGAGSGGAGGGGSAAVAAVAISLTFRRYIYDFMVANAGAMTLMTNGRNCSGGGGGGDGTAGGGGGSGGAPGNGMAIHARRIQRGANTTAAIIQSIGGLGGAGGSAIAGNRGGGGGGGRVVIFNLRDGAGSALDPVAGAGGGAASGTTGGIGAAQVVTRVAL